MDLAETKARETAEVRAVGARVAPFVAGSSRLHLIGCNPTHTHAQTEEAMWQQELEMRRQKRLAQQEKRELQQYIKRQMEEQQRRRDAERAQWRSLEPPPQKQIYGGITMRDQESHLLPNLVPDGGSCTSSSTSNETTLGQV